MTIARKKNKAEVSITQAALTTLCGVPSETTFEQAAIIARDALLQGLQMLREVAKRRNDQRVMRHIQTIVETLDGLEERIVRNQLPKAVIRMILSDARLDSIIAHSDIKVSIMYDHQELIAPNETLRIQVRESRRLTKDSEGCWIDASQLSVQQGLAIIQEDLQTLRQAHQLMTLESVASWLPK